MITKHEITFSRTVTTNKDDEDRRERADERRQSRRNEFVEKIAQLLSPLIFHSEYTSHPDGSDEDDEDENEIDPRNDSPPDGPSFGSGNPPQDRPTPEEWRNQCQNAFDACRQQATLADLEIAGPDFERLCADIVVGRRHDRQKLLLLVPYLASLLESPSPKLEAWLSDYGRSMSHQGIREHKRRLDLFGKLKSLLDLLRAEPTVD